MRLPNRSISSIQPLPSIYTTFPPNYDSNQSTDTSGINSGTCFLPQIEDGIEVVPFERSNHLSAPILSPEQPEKEVFVLSQEEMQACEKPLPSLPQCIWQRMSKRRRILVLLVLQFLLLLTIGLSLLAVKHRPSESDHASTERSSGDDSSQDGTSAIQRGIFALSVGRPQQQISSCLAKTNESVAWQCASDTMMQLSVFPAPIGDDNATMIAIGLPPSNDSISHGELVPTIPPVELLALEEAGTGDNPTYYFRTTYDRVVLVRDDAFNSVKKRQPIKLDAVFLPGDSLWQCTFNETQIEGYIYGNESKQPGNTIVASDVANATTTSTRLPEIPYSVKLIEERMPNGRVPYCEKMVVHHDNTLVFQAERITLKLSDPAAEVAASATRSIKRARYQERQEEDDSDHCRCQWVVQPSGIQP